MRPALPGRSPRKPLELQPKSVVHDGEALVRRNVGVGARVEAGLNLAGDAASVVMGPEDAAVERGAVFAVSG